MTEYEKKVYKLKNKSSKGIQHYGFVISINGKAIIRQWHKPRVMGHVFMTEEEANQEADDMITSFTEIDNTPSIIIPDDKIIELETRVKQLEKQLNKSIT